MPNMALLFPFSMGNGKVGTFQMRFGIGAGGELTEMELQTAANEAMAEYQDGVPLFASDVHLGQVEAYTYERVLLPKVHFAPISVRIVAEANGNNGSAAGTSVAPQLSTVVSFRTHKAGGRFRGRVFTPPPPEANVDGAGNVSTTQALEDWIRGIAEGIENLGIGWARDVDHIVHSVTYGDQTEVIRYEAGTKVDTQRRRRSRG